MSKSIRTELNYSTFHEKIKLIIQLVWLRWVGGEEYDDVVELSWGWLALKVQKLSELESALCSRSQWPMTPRFQLLSLRLWTYNRKHKSKGSLNQKHKTGRISRLSVPVEMNLNPTDRRNFRSVLRATTDDENKVIFHNISQ